MTGMVPIYDDLTQVNYNTSNRGVGKIKYLVIHYTGSPNDTPKNETTYYKSVYRKASAHYFVGPDYINRCVKDKDIAWHCGTTGKYYNNTRNSTSIGIELCSKKMNTSSKKASDTDWYFDERVLANTVDLVVMLMKKYGLTDVDSQVVRHYDVTHKICPNPFCVNAEAKSDWVKFKNRIKKALGQYVDDMPVVKPSVSTPSNTSQNAPRPARSKVAEFQIWMNTNYGERLDVDGSFGPASRKAAVMCWQRQVNADTNARLAVDGSFGPACSKAASRVILNQGKNGKLVTIAQGLLYAKKYEPSGLDGSFGPGMKCAVKQFQANCETDVDGSIGPNTWKLLLTKW